MAEDLPDHGGGERVDAEAPAHDDAVLGEEVEFRGLAVREVEVEEVDDAAEFAVAVPDVVGDVGDVFFAAGGVALEGTDEVVDEVLGVREWGFAAARFVGLRFFGQGDSVLRDGVEEFRHLEVGEVVEIFAAEELVDDLSAIAFPVLHFLDPFAFPLAFASCSGCSVRPQSGFLELGFRLCLEALSPCLGVLLLLFFGVGAGAPFFVGLHEGGVEVKRWRVFANRLQLSDGAAARRVEDHGAQRLLHYDFCSSIGAEAPPLSHFAHHLASGRPTAGGIVWFLW